MWSGELVVRHRVEAAYGLVAKFVTQRGCERELDTRAFRPQRDADANGKPFVDVRTV